MGAAGARGRGDSPAGAAPAALCRCWRRLGRFLNDGVLFLTRCNSGQNISMRIIHGRIGVQTRLPTGAGDVERMDVDCGHVEGGRWTGGAHTPPWPQGVPAIRGLRVFCRAASRIELVLDVDVFASSRRLSSAPVCNADAGFARQATSSQRGAPPTFSPILSMQRIYLRIMSKSTGHGGTLPPCPPFRRLWE